MSGPAARESALRTALAADPGGVRRTAAACDRAAVAASLAATRLARLERLTGWSGPSARGWAVRTREVAADLRESERSHREAAGALSAYATAVEEAQRRIRVALATGAAGTEEAVDEAARMVAGAADELDAAARRAAARLYAEAGMAAPTHHRAGSGLGGFLHDLGAGLVDGVRGPVELFAHLSPVGLVADPAGAIRTERRLAESLVGAVRDPLGFGKAAIDWEDWISGHPGRAVGELLPSAVAAVASGGGAAAARGARAVTAVETRTAALRLGGRLVGPGDPLNDFLGRVRPQPGFYDVALHGSEHEFAYLRGDGLVAIFDHRTVARFVASQPDYGGQPVRLLSCRTGAPGGTAAQDLANKMGVDVLAPTDTVWVRHDGSLVIGPEPTADTGSWTLFRPGGAVAR